MQIVSESRHRAIRPSPFHVLSFFLSLSSIEFSSPIPSFIVAISFSNLCAFWSMISVWFCIFTLVFLLFPGIVVISSIRNRQSVSLISKILLILLRPLKHLFLLLDRPFCYACAVFFLLLEFYFLRSMLFFTGGVLFLAQIDIFRGCLGSRNNYYRYLLIHVHVNRERVWEIFITSIVFTAEFTIKECMPLWFIRLLEQD